MAIIQGLSQLDQRYTAAGRDKILQGSKHQIFFASNDQQTTNYVSETLGKKTIQTVSKSRSKQGRTISRQSQSRELMMPQEVREMSPDNLILITEGTRPIIAKKIRYFKDATLSARAKLEKTPVPILNLDPKFSPTLEDIAGSKIAENIRDANKGDRGAKAAVTPEQKKRPQFENMLKVIKDRKTPDI